MLPGSGIAVPIPVRDQCGCCSKSTLRHSLQVKHHHKHYHPPRNAFGCSSTRGRVLPGSTRPNVLPRAAPASTRLLPASGAQGAPQQPPGSPATSQGARHGEPQGRVRAEGAGACTSGEGAQRGIGCPQAVPTQQARPCPLPRAHGSGAAAALAPGGGCQAFSGYKTFLGSRPKHSPADHPAWQSLQLPQSHPQQQVRAARAMFASFVAALQCRSVLDDGSKLQPLSGLLHIPQRCQGNIGRVWLGLLPLFQDNRGLRQGFVSEIVCPFLLLLCEQGGFRQVT